MSPKRENPLWKTQKSALLSNFGVLVGLVSDRAQPKSEATTTFEVNDGDGIVAQGRFTREKARRFERHQHISDLN
jgi:hypothetical protein